MVGKEGEQGSSMLVIGEIVSMHVREDVLFFDNKSGRPKISLENLKPIARLAGFSYSTITEVFDIQPEGKKK